MVKKRFVFQLSTTQSEGILDITDVHLNKNDKKEASNIKLQEIKISVSCGNVLSYCFPIEESLLVNYTWAI